MATFLKCCASSPFRPPQPSCLSAPGTYAKCGSRAVTTTLMDEQMKFAHREFFSRREGDVRSGCSIEPSAGSKSGWRLQSRSPSRSRSCQPAASSALAKTLVGVKGRCGRSDTLKASESVRECCGIKHRLLLSSPRRRLQGSTDQPRSRLQGSTHQEIRQCSPRRCSPPRNLLCR